MTNYLLNIYLDRNLEIEYGKGCYLFDKNGNKYLDLMSNYGANIFGYGNKFLNQIACEQINKLIHLHSSFSNSLRNDLAKKILEKCSYQGKVFYVNSGSEAIEVALKFALFYSKKTGILAMENSYHGKTLGSLSLTFNEKYRSGLEKFLLNVTFTKFGDWEDFQKKLNDDIGVVILEPLQGDGGLYVAPDGYLKAISDICQQKNIVLIIDEIQTGIGRTGKFLASHYENISPSLICLGKGIANGFPLSVVVVNDDIAQKIPKFFHTSTFGGHLVACQVALNVLEMIDDRLLTEIKEKGNYLINELRKINHPLITEVRGRGLMIGIEVKDKRTEIIKELQKNFILVIPAGENTIRLLPPYIITFEQLNYFLEVFKKILNNYV